MSSLRISHISLCLFMIAALPGCSSDPDDQTITSDIAPECNPLGGVACLMPWPSSVYLTEASTATGYRLALPAEAMPVNVNGSALDPGPYNRFDGFSPSGPILAAFPNGVSAEGLPSHRDPAASLAADSATVVVNMDTGERLLHFAEIDMNQIYPEDRALVIRPLERMDPGARYAVAIRTSVKDSGGADLPVPAAFQALREGTRYEHPLMDRLAPRYDAIFAALEAEGVSPGEMVLAWDFVTASDDFLTGDLTSMRAQALPGIEAAVDFTADEVVPAPAAVYRSILGTYPVPSFLSSGEQDDSVLVRDAAGMPVHSGTFDAPFAAILPACVSDPAVSLPIPVIVFGHGLFGSGAAYLDDNLLQQVANQFCFVIVAGDFIGLTRRQLPMVANVANDLNRANRIADKLAQSIIDFIALGHFVRGPFVTHSLFLYEDQQVIDPDRVFYLGASLGGIMGNVFMAYDPSIVRGALGVPGGAWALLFERSLAWGALQLVASSAYRDEVRSFQLLVAFLGMTMEPFDPITTASRVVHDPLPGTPAKQILMYQGVGDSLVSNLSTEMTARTMGIQVVGPSLYVPHGMLESAEPLTSGLTIYDEHREPLPPETNIPPAEDNGTHGGVNERAAVLRQIQRFFFEGDIVNMCQLDGVAVPCDCATGACD
jgi:hypothetical protein